MRPTQQWASRILLRLSLAVSNLAATSAFADAPPATPIAPGIGTAPLSGDAQKLYAQAKPYILQVRTLTAAGRSQAGVGSGFFIGPNGLAITNYHVVAKLALEPERYVGETIDTEGGRSELSILALDVLNDLALLRVRNAPAGHLALHRAPDELRQGQRLYSLGNPLDLGFAISEGGFNGVLARPYYDQILFSGAINPGMSGGPALAQDGSVVGVNVAKRLDGELISFLVPARFVSQLIDKAQTAQQAGHADQASLRKGIGDQLMAHQTMMTQRLLTQPFDLRSLGNYAVPVHESKGVRCWGRSPHLPDKPYRVNNLECRMESAIYVDEGLRTGFVNIRHEHLAATRLGALRFSVLYGGAFRNEYFGSIQDAQMTGPHCQENFIRTSGAQAPSLRAVLCVRALRDFNQLYEFNLLTASLDDSRTGVQSRIDVSGVSFENGERITRRFLEALRKLP